MKSGGWVAGGIFIAVWSVVTLTFDIMLVRFAVQQAQTQSWPTASGRIESARVVTSTDSEGGTAYHAKISYGYTVNGQRHHGERIRFTTETSGSRSARRTVGKYPVGREVIVHFNPRDPAEAVLETSLICGGDLFMLIFMTPFNVVMVAGWAVAWGVVSGSHAKRPAGNAVRIFEQPRGVRVRLTQFTPLGAAGGAAAVMAFALTFIVGIFIGTDSLNAAAAGWAVIVAASIIGYSRMRSRIEQEWYDLIIRDDRQTLALAPSLKRPEVQEVPFSAVMSVDVVKKMGSGDDSDSFRTVLRWTDAQREEQSVTLIDVSAPKSAETLASWLRRRIGIQSENEAVTEPTTAGSAHA
jgi:hypothetical protein